ncbi:MAG: hypothetical protein PHT80_02105 [Lentisphaeria bacterium]|nr:hypothetical protein [Lentisphaeria bacterium]
MKPIRQFFARKKPALAGADRQRGMALMLVLGVLATVLLMVAHLMTVAEVIAKEAKVAALRSEMRYQAEAAADTGFWMLLTDRRLFANRKLGQSLEAREAVSDFEPWMVDRRAHAFDNDSCYVYLQAAEQAFIVTKPEALKDNVDPDDQEKLDEISEFIDVLNDYTDRDDLKKLYGKEVDDYAADGFPTLPRNNAMQFREELYWLPNWQNCVVGEVTVIPPRNINYVIGKNKPSFFSASEDYVKQVLDLGDNEWDAIEQAREEWANNGTPLEESLDAALYQTILGAFDFNEADLAAISAVSHAPGDPRIRLHVQVIREVKITSGTIFSDREQETFSIWEKKLH